MSTSFPGVVLATHNHNKVRELQELMPEYQVISMSDIGFKDDIPENGRTFMENAVTKALAVQEFLEKSKRKCQYIVIAEDSGLCVNVLGGRPGVYTARYGGTDCDDQMRRDLLRDELTGEIDRSAYYQCDLVALVPGKTEMITASAKTLGEIIDYELGTRGFAYDSIFYSSDLGMTFAEATPEQKNSVSHRGRAVSQLLKKLTAISWS